MGFRSNDLRGVIIMVAPISGPPAIKAQLLPRATQSRISTRK
jgi:hypothetical protein